MRNSPWLVFTYTVIILLGILIALPNALPQSTLARLPSWLPHNQVSLGLDLRGGSHLVLEVDEADLTRERLQSLLQDARRVLREKNIQVRLDSFVDLATIRKVETVLDELMTEKGFANSRIWRAASPACACRSRCRCRRFCVACCTFC